MTKKKTRVERWGNNGLILTPSCAYSFEISAWDKSNKVALPGILPLTNAQEWETQPIRIGDFEIVPMGTSNMLPFEIRDILESNNLSEGVFRRQRGLLWGQGPHLYQSEWVNNQKVRTWREDTEIETWLKSFNYEEVLRKLMVDYYHMEGCYSKFILNRGSLVGGQSFIAKVEHVGYHRARLEWPDDNLNVANIIVGDWYNPNITNLKRYPVFNATVPFRHPISIQFINMASFARDFYGVPAYYGALNWIKRGNAIPRILESLTANTLNIKFHIKSPASYWENKKEMLLNNATIEGNQYTDKMLEDLKDATFAQLAEVLSGETNVGKFFTSEYTHDDLGKLEGWEIEPIDMKVKDYIDAQLNIAKQADNAITSGLGLHPSLSNILIEGKLASGSELLYALKLFLATETDIPELIICSSINHALNANWPGKKLKIGFYHEIVKTEDSVSPEKRVKNAV